MTIQLKEKVRQLAVHGEMQIVAILNEIGNLGIFSAKGVFLIDLSDNAKLKSTGQSVERFFFSNESIFVFTKDLLLLFNVNTLSVM